MECGWKGSGGAQEQRLLQRRRDEACEMCSLEDGRFFSVDLQYRVNGTALNTALSPEVVTGAGFVSWEGHCPDQVSHKKHH